MVQKTAQSKKVHCYKFETNTSLLTYSFVMFMLISQPLNSVRERKLSVGEWFKLAITFCTL